MGKDQCGHRGESNNVFSLRSSGSWPILRRNVSILCCFTYIYLYYTQPLHDRVLAEFFPMYEGEFTVFRAGFLAIQFKTKMHKIGTRIAFLLEEKKSTIFLPTLVFFNNKSTDCLVWISLYNFIKLLLTIILQSSQKNNLQCLLSLY